MNLLAIILGYTASMACLIGVLAFGALGFPLLAIGSGVLAVWTAFGAAHLAKVRQNSRKGRVRGREDKAKLICHEYPTCRAGEGAHDRR